MSELRVSRCERCRRLVFPSRELCPHCGSAAFAEQVVDSGAVVGVTSHRGTTIACVDISGTRVLARADGGARAGAAVALTAEGGAPVAHPSHTDPQ